jgi:endonuclease/exonuclease/phosphatase family metal-dependent hydrolase
VKRVALALAILAIAVVRCQPCGGRSTTPWRFATFNIENYPKHERQSAAAFAEIAGLDAGVVAVQEITDPELFARAATAALGPSWRFTAIDTGLSPHYLGVLYDTRAWIYAGTIAHDETKLAEGRQKPVLEVRLRAAETGDDVRVFVVHLKAGGDGRDIRARQYPALAGILGKVPAGAHAIVLGDFNATDDRGDRDDLRTLGERTKLTWATEALACSALWDRDDGCFRSRLDHVLAWRAPSKVEALGACATDGCARQDRCPRYLEQVSDHCPVVVTF